MSISFPIVRTDYGIAFGHAFGRAMGLPHIRLECGPAGVPNGIAGRPKRVIVPYIIARQPTIGPS